MLRRGQPWAISCPEVFGSLDNRGQQLEIAGFTVHNARNRNFEDKPCSYSFRDRAPNFTVPETSLLKAPRNDQIERSEASQLF